MVTLANIHHAAFWGEALCLSCGFAGEAEPEAFEGDRSGQPTECPRCGAKGFWDGEQLLEVIEKIKSEENGG